ncbi:zinc ribbon domain-containing protein [Patescibacteria group bacterium]|nr:zinc ribbon domain-containing protein [Patescibacteria group bacterium]
MVADILNFLAQSSTTTIIVAYIFALWAALTIWTWFDISNRTRNFFYRIGAMILVALGSLLGFVIYLMLRPSQTRDEVSFRELEEKIFESQSKSALCFNCSEVVHPEFTYCANCGEQVRKNCQNCEREISFTWNICPFCSRPQNEIPKLPIIGAVAMEDGVESSRWGKIISVLSIVRRIRLPKVSGITLKKGGKKRGRPRKEKTETETSKRPRGRPRKEITPISSEA